MSVVDFIPARSGGDTPPPTPEPPTPEPPFTLTELMFALKIDPPGESGAFETGLMVQLERQLDAATAMAERQAPGAPVAVKVEAIIRAVGWLHEGIDVEPSMTGIWIRCGAKGLLAPWTVRRAGLVAVEESA